MSFQAIAIDDNGSQSISYYMRSQLGFLVFNPIPPIDSASIPRDCGQPLNQKGPIRSQKKSASRSGPLHRPLARDAKNQAESLSTRFLRVELSDDEIQAYEAHLSTCTSCRNRLEEKTASTNEWDARPITAVAFKVDSNDKGIFELENMHAVDDRGNQVPWMAPGPFNFYHPNFEIGLDGEIIAYFQEENDTEHPTISRELKVTPGRRIELEFPDGKPA